MLIHQFLENSAAQYPDKVAVIHDSHRATYGQINNWANNLAAYLQSNGVAKGDRVALLLENGINYVVAYYAILKTGAVAVPLNPGLKPDGLRFHMSHVEPAVLITSCKSERLLKATNIDEAFLKCLIIKTPKQQWRGAPYTVADFDECTKALGVTISGMDIQSSDLASIIYTSGSTGEPKGVMLSHGNIVSNTRSICQYLSITHNDIQMVVLPFFYVMGKSLLNTHIASGGTVVINNRFMYPADVVNEMIKEGVTSFSGVPSTYAYLLNRSPLAKCRKKLSALRYCSQAGGHMAKSLKLVLQEALPPHTQTVIMYGATEASARLTYLPPEHFQTKIESIGKPIPDVTVRILDEQGKEVSDGQEGVLVAEGPNIMMGYWKNPRDTKCVLRKYGYYTGDIGYRDSEGFLYVIGRKDGLLKVSGHRVNPVEIEDFLISTNLIIEATVTGLQDSLLGTRIVALVVFKDEACRPKALMEKCAGSLPNYKCPSAVINVRVLPKNANGKIDRDKCILIAADESKSAVSG